MILAREIDKRVKITLIQEGPWQNLVIRQEEHLPPVPRPHEARPAKPSSGTEPLAVPDHLRKEIENTYPFMNAAETTSRAYRDEIESCFLAISEAVNDLLRHGYDHDQIIEALHITIDMATQQLATAWQAALKKGPQP